MVASHWRRQEEADREPLEKLALAAVGRQPASLGAGLSAPEADARWDDRSSWRLPDLTVGLAIAVVLVTLAIPALHYSRFSSRITACQSNLHQLGVALIDYSKRHNGYFPPVPVQGTMAFAGMYGPTLLRAGLLENSRWTICPGSPLADAKDFYVPSEEQILAEPTPEGRIRLQRWAGGSFGYGFGYWKDGRYHYPRNLGRNHFALMSDAPVFHNTAYSSMNHGGRGFNVLFETGGVLFVNSTTPNGCQGHIHLNDANDIGVGLQVHDEVISPSTTRPVLPAGLRSGSLENPGSTPP
jgi:hypothetical protein